MEYYRKCLPYVTCQPVNHKDVSASIMELNTQAYVKQQSKEQEWNMEGLASGLTEKEYCAKKLEKIQSRMSKLIRKSIQKAEAGGNVELKKPAEKGDLRIKGSRFMHTEKLQFAEETTKTSVQKEVFSDEELKKQREQELEDLQTQLAQISQSIDHLDIQSKKTAAGTQQMEEEIKKERDDSKDKEQLYKVKKQTMDLLPDAEVNIIKLQNTIDASAARLLTLSQQWEIRRVPLVDKYREVKTVNSHKMENSQRQLEEIKSMREQMKSFTDDVRQKEELHKQLIYEYERMTKDVNRSTYTKRILEIVANIKKQKADIDKVLIDTRALQKEINQLTGKLDRTFTVTDELIFKDAKQDESVRKAYKYLAALHENCSAVVQTVEESGVILREIRDLEDQIETEKQQKTSSNLEKITGDYKEIKAENASLIKKLKQAQST